MKQKKPKAFIPIYAFALGWIVCAFFIPMYTLGGLVGSAAISAAVAVVAWYTAKMILARSLRSRSPSRSRSRRRNPRSVLRFRP